MIQEENIEEKEKEKHTNAHMLVVQLAGATSLHPSCLAPSRRAVLL